MTRESTVEKNRIEALPAVDPTGAPTGFAPTALEPTGFEPTGFEPTGFEPTQWPERLESLKAGAIGGISSGLTWGSLEWGLSPWRGGTGWLMLTLGCAVAGLTGFLFGVTYRYVIRHDRNPHLKSGAVGAFALARGLAQIEPRLVEQLPLLPSGQWSLSAFALMLLLLGQNLVMLTIARWGLDFAMLRGWIKRFG
jgi:hypothetical protein